MIESGSNMDPDPKPWFIGYNLLHCAGRREDTDEKGSEEVRTTVSSTIRFRPSVEDNLKAVTCEAQHPALQAGPLTASLNIFVQRECIDLMFQTFYHLLVPSPPPPPISLSSTGVYSYLTFFFVDPTFFYRSEYQYNTSLLIPVC